jgi:hypothetical protein
MLVALLGVARNQERAAHQVTNICERVVFTVTGEMNEMDVKEPPPQNALSKTRDCAILGTASFGCLSRRIR